MRRPRLRRCGDPHLEGELAVVVGAPAVDADILSDGLGDEGQSFSRFGRLRGDLGSAAAPAPAPTFRMKSLLLLDSVPRSMAVENGL